MMENDPRLVMITALVWATVVIAPMAAGASYWISRGVARMARSLHVLDVPVEARKIHDRPVPLWGGLGIALVLLLGLYVARHALFFSSPYQTFTEQQLMGYGIGVLVLLLGGLLDDRQPLPPTIQLLFPMLASICVIASGTGIIQVTHPVTHLGYSLVWWKVWNLSLPADLLTFLWLLIATYATKLLDGLDGLVSGMVVIGTGLVGALSLSLSYFQPSVAYLSALVGGAYLGFLPRNRYPAKQFLGEAGATIAGFSLGVLAILSSAKIAIALAVLAIPMTDAVLVVAGRIRRGAAWYKGDTTHLHFRLLQVGFSQRSAVSLFWSASLLAGLIALSLQTRGKLFLIGALIVLTALASYVVRSRARRKTGAA